MTTLEKRKKLLKKRIAFSKKMLNINLDKNSVFNQIDDSSSIVSFLAILMLKKHYENHEQDSYLGIVKIALTMFR